MTDTSFTSSPEAAKVFDRNIVRLHRHRAAQITARKRFGDANFLFMEVADRLVDRLLDVKRCFDLALDMGCHSGEVHHWLQNCPGKVVHLLQCDMAAAYAKAAKSRAAKVRFEKSSTASFVADEESLPVKPESLDLIISNLSLHWVNDLPGALAQIRQSLKPDGLFMGSMMGGESLFEMRSAIMQAEMELYGGISPRVSPFADIRDAGSLMQRAGFNLPVLDSEVIDVTYKNLFKLAQDLRNMGETNSMNERKKSFSSRNLFMRAAEIYAKKHINAQGRLPASFVIIYMHGWAPAPGQQQPAKRGSGKTSLADFFAGENEDNNEKESRS